MNDNSNGEWKVIGETQTSKEKKPEIGTTKISGIYGLRNMMNNKWYIGQSTDINRRLKNYGNLSCKSQPKIYNAIVKYGYQNFEKVILEQCDPDVHILNEKEPIWIKKYNSMENGYNLRAGGDSGGRPSEETCKKISKSNTGKTTSNVSKERMRVAKLGKKLTIEHVENISKGNTGKTRTQEFCEHMSVIRTGMVFSEEHCANIAKSKTGTIMSEEIKEKMRKSQQKRRLSPVSEETRKKSSISAKMRELKKRIMVGKTTKP